jgi:hypothetical protein
MAAWGGKTLSNKYMQQRAVVPCVGAKSGGTMSVRKYGGKYWESERKIATRNY